jgi:CDP-glycerol glycerophosphotransferase (TagB/SpsB family)
MALLTSKEIKQLEPLLADLEREEPILSAWRFHLRKGEKFRRIAADCKDFIKSNYFGLKKITIPKEGQPIFLMTVNTPSGAGTLLPIIEKLNEVGQNPFLVVNKKKTGSKSANILEINELIFSSLRFVEIKKLKEKAKELVEEINRRVPDCLSLNKYSLFQGLAAKAVSEKMITDGFTIVSDSDKEFFRKGVFIGVTGKKVNTMVLQHGFFDRLLFPIHANYHIDWGPYFSQKALNFGHPLERSVSLGCPRFDRIKEIKKETKDPNYFKKYGIDKRPVVVALSGVHIYEEFPQSIEKFFESIISLIKNNIAVVIKRHPAEVDFKIYEKFLGKKLLQKVHFSFKDEDFHKLLYNSDFIFTNASAASMEAMLLGVPVLWQNGAEENPFPDIPLMGGGVYVNSATIANVVKEIGTDGSEREEVILKQENFLSQAIVNRGKATEAVVDFILTSIRERE